MPNIPNAVTERLNTVELTAVCGCKIHIKRVIENGQVISETPIDKYYGIYGQENEHLYETSRCERHSNIDNLQELHDKIADEGITSGKAIQILKDTLSSEYTVEITDEETGEKIKVLKNPIGYSFDDENNKIIFFSGLISEEEKSQVQSAWDNEFGSNKIVFHG